MHDGQSRAPHIPFQEVIPLDRIHPAILRSCSFAILMANKEKGKGYGFEASKILLSHAFLNLNLHRVYLVVVEWNKPAIKMYEKLGFQRDGVLRDAFWARGKYHKLLYYSVLRNEFEHL